MGRKSDLYKLINTILKRKNDKEIEELTNELINNLQVDKDPKLQMCGDVIQSIRNYWYMKYQKLYDKNLEEWEDENEERNKEIDKRIIYQETAQELSVYKPFYNPFRIIYTKNKNMSIYRIGEEYRSKQKDYSFLWESNKSDLNLDEIELLESKGIDNFTRKAAFIILLHRYKNNKDFPIKFDFSNDDNIQDEYEKFIKQYDKSPNAKRK